MTNFAPMLTHEQQFTAQQYLLVYAAQQYLRDTFQGRMPVGQCGFFLHAGVDPWPYRDWSSNAARELFKSGWLVANHPDDINEPKARWVRLNLQRCYYEYVDSVLYFCAGTARFDTEYVRNDLNEILITLDEI